MGCVDDKLILFFCYRQLEDRALLCKIYRDICSKLRWQEIPKVERRFYTVWSLKGYWASVAYHHWIWVSFAHRDIVYFGQGLLTVIKEQCHKIVDTFFYQKTTTTTNPGNYFTLEKVKKTTGKEKSNKKFKYLIFSKIV